MACSRAGCASGAVTQTSMDRSISSLVRTKVNAISCRAARVRGDPPYSAIFAKRGDLPLRVLPDGSYQSTSLDFQRPILTSHREQKRGRNEGPQGAVWREGDVPIKASRPHKSLIPQFELSTFPRPFPLGGGTRIRRRGGCTPLSPMSISIHLSMETMDSTHFLMKTLEHVGTEMSLHVLAYNLKRLISVLGIAKRLKAVQMARA